MAQESGLAPGWYPHADAAPNTLRYWDGATWTENYKAVDRGAPEAKIPGWLTFVGYATMILMPVAGFVIGLHHLSRNRQGDGVILVIGSVLFATIFGFMFLNA